MKKVLRGLGSIVLVLIALLMVVAVYARMHDGPVRAFAGGTLDSGPWNDSHGIDWSFAADLPTLELQLLEPPRSRTVWMIHHDGKLFIPCGIPNFTLWKKWPHEAVANGEAVIRIEGRRYAVKLVKTDDRDEISAVRAGLAEKYDAAAPGAEEAGDLLWIFRVEPRQADA
ncbi:MAG: hypothetical protein GY910_27590 [bacterium]|nr:hypothetical protein [Deltaproteobacteria bacterium]MCP4908756.1 hypothetical protein [bacterium]